jgi:hypothetical protein
MIRLKKVATPDKRRCQAPKFRPVSIIESEKPLKTITGIKQNLSRSGTTRVKRPSDPAQWNIQYPVGIVIKSMIEHQTMPTISPNSPLNFPKKGLWPGSLPPRRRRLPLCTLRPNAIFGQNRQHARQILRKPRVYASAKLHRRSRSLCSSSLRSSAVSVAKGWGWADFFRRSRLGWPAETVSDQIINRPAAPGWVGASHWACKTCIDIQPNQSVNTIWPDCIPKGRICSGLQAGRIMEPWLPCDWDLSRLLFALI